MLNEKKDLLSINFTKFANSVLEEINYARVYPLKYYNKMADWSKYIKSDETNTKFVIDIPNKSRMKISDIENYSSAMKFVRGRVPTSPLTVLDCLVNSTADYLAVIQMKDDGQTKVGSKFLQTKDEFVKRLLRFGSPQGVVGESIDIGEVDAELLVLKLILDEDSNVDRPNRILLFNNKLKLVGISAGVLPTSQESVTIIDMCENFFFKNTTLFTIPKQKGYSPTTSVMSNSDKKSNFNTNENFFKSSMKMYKENDLLITKQHSLPKISNGGFSQPSTPKTTTNSFKSEIVRETNRLNYSSNGFNKTSNSFHNGNNNNNNYASTTNTNMNTLKINQNKNVQNVTNDKNVENESDLLLCNGDIESYNVRKKIIKDKNNNEKILITKTVIYKDGSIDEMTYKIDS